MVQLTEYKKTITAIVGALIAFGSMVVFSEPTEITAPEWLSLAIGLATAFGVYQVPNEPS